MINLCFKNLNLMRLSIVRIIPKSLQVQTQVNLVTLGWCGRNLHVQISVFLQSER